MFHPGFPPGINRLRGWLLILGFQSLFDLLQRKTDDFPTLLGGRTGPIMLTTVTNLSAGNLIMPLAVVLIGPPVTQPMPGRTPVTIRLSVIPKPALTERPFLFV
jgi:hypothetical protein